MAAYFGTAFGDVLTGEAGADTLFGRGGGDTLTGGAGQDRFVIDDGESSSIGGLLDDGASADVITDWSDGDRLVFAHTRPPEAPESLFAGVALDYSEAFGMAQTAFQDGFEYASIKVGADVFVFAPRTDSVVKLAGVDPASVSGAALSPDMIDGDDATLGAGADRFDGAAGSDTVHGLDGDDVLMGGDGSDRLFGGADNDTVDGGDGFNYLRGDDGDDVVNGGAQHDDINGNMGRDTIFAGDGDDWVHGGKDDDVVAGGNGHDLLFGDLGNDTVGGGQGDDLIFGGDGNDILRGDDGEDILVGGAGRDTLDGGLGADLFVAYGGSGDDRVIHFSVEEGDQVLVERGSAYTVTQDGADTVIEMAGGRMVLADVQLSSLPTGWLLEG